ncbi:hypothetical protein BST61_g11451 [Cercospora zeina]
MFRITAIQEKGRGVVASQPIPAGTLILSEVPIVTVPKYTNEKHYSKIILPQLQHLTVAQKHEFFDLSNNFHEMRPIEGIAKTNAIPLGPSASVGALFLRCSRFNHGCTPNAAYHWNESVLEERVYSVRDIDDGDEITVKYLSEEQWALPGRERRQQILAAFGFQCKCKRCTTGQACGESESDGRRIRLGSIDRAIGGGELIMTDPSKALSMCREALKLLQEEEEAAPRLESVYYDAFQICTKKLWQGGDAPGLMEMEAYIRNPESHGLALHTRKWYSGSAKTATRLGQRGPEWLWRRAES